MTSLLEQDFKQLHKKKLTEKKELHKAQDFPVKNDIKHDFNVMIQIMLLLNQKCVKQRVHE